MPKQVTCDHGQYGICTDCPHQAPHKPQVRANEKGLCTDVTIRCYPWLDRPLASVRVTCKGD